MPENFPTLGFLAADWIEQHCCVPDGFNLGAPLVHDGWQLLCDLQHYRVRDGIEFHPSRPLQGQAFVYRRSVVVGPQKVGKSPWRGSVDLFEAVGPCLFGGWAKGGEVYECGRDGGCGCGWSYVYEPGEPMGLVRPKSLIQIVATADDQVDNVYLPIQTMVRQGPLQDLIRVNEWGLRLPNDGKLEPVTSKATTRLGAPINYAGADESGLYTDRNGMRKTWDTMRRGLGGMDGRSIETTNPWDPVENSSAQRAFTAGLDDVFVHYRKPVTSQRDFRLSKRARRKAYEDAYTGSPWVNLDGIEAVAEELISEGDWSQAARFYGNLLVQGLGSFMDEAIWDAATIERAYPGRGTAICLGMDGSRNNDWTALRAETVEGYRFTPTFSVGGELRPTIWNPQLHRGEIPRLEVRAAVEYLFSHFRVERFYIDPKFWETQADDWALQFGEDHVITWPTSSISRIDPALRRYLQDLKDGATVHDGCVDTRAHVLNARKVAKPGERYTLGKPSEHQKIDLAMSDVLAHEAASDARADGWKSFAEPTIFRLPR